MRAGRALMLLLGLSLGSSRAYMLGVAPSASQLCASRVAAVMAAENESAVTAGESSGEESAAAAILARDAAMTAALENAAMTESATEPEAPLAPAPPPAPPPVPYLEESDLVNTRWIVTFTPRPEAWRGGDVEEQEFALLQDGSVRWAGQAGGAGVGGRWQLRDSTLEVIRTTPLGLVTGRDYYMSIVQARVRLPPLHPSHPGPARSSQRLGPCLPWHSAPLCRIAR